jgi:DNA repair ATPase RecN
MLPEIEQAITDVRTAAKRKLRRVLSTLAAIAAVAVVAIAAWWLITRETPAEREMRELLSLPEITVDECSYKIEAINTFVGTLAQDELEIERQSLEQSKNRLSDKKDLYRRLPDLEEAIDLVAAGNVAPEHLALVTAAWERIDRGLERYSADYPDDPATVEDIRQRTASELRRIPPGVVTPELEQVIRSAE